MDNEKQPPALPSSDAGGSPPAEAPHDAVAPDAAPATPRSPRSGLGLALLVLLAAIAGLGVLGWLPRQERAARLEAQAAERSAPLRVSVARVADAPSDTVLTLPATTLARDAVDVVARAEGYVRAYHADLGAQVRAGQLLAEMSAPERDDEIHIASVRVSEAEQRLSITRTTAGRTTQLSGAGVLSGQEGDDAELGLTSVNAALDSSRAELRRLRTLRGYQRIVAPFDGIVTARLVQQGTLVNAGSTVLFRIERPELKVVIDVPQEHATAITAGMEAEVLQGERVLATGHVSRVASALSPSTRTMRVELDVPPTEALRSGMYLRARLRAPRTTPMTLLPARALLMTPEGASAWVVGQDATVRLVRLGVARDRGRDLEITSGLSAGDRVVLSAPDGLREGLLVTPVERSAAPAGAAPAGAAPAGAAPAAAPTGAPTPGGGAR